MEFMGEGGYSTCSSPEKSHYDPQGRFPGSNECNISKTHRSVWNNYHIAYKNTAVTEREVMTPTRNNNQEVFTTMSSGLKVWLNKE